MSIEDIISAVRNCIDEGNYNDSYISASSGDLGTMNDLIKSKVDDALRWLCLYAPVRMLRGGGLIENINNKTVVVGELVTTGSFGEVVPGEAEGTDDFWPSTRYFLFEMDDIKEAINSGFEINLIGGGLTNSSGQQLIVEATRDSSIFNPRHGNLGVNIQFSGNVITQENLVSALGDDFLDKYHYIWIHDPGALLTLSGEFKLNYYHANKKANRLILPHTFIRLVRVKCENWHRAVMEKTLLAEDSDEYLQLMDSHGAEATDDRPQAALIENKNTEIELWPAPNSDDDIDLAYIAMPTYDIDTDVPVPSLAITAFTYYIAYVILVAYGDARAESMLRIANQSIGATVQ